MGIGVSLMVIAAGAILRFAVSLHAGLGSARVDWYAVGDVLMVVGALGFAFAVALLVDGSRAAPRPGPFRGS
jgi:hypothetical protein